MIDVVFFVNSLNSGGLENYLLRFLTLKSSQFNKIYIWCKSGKVGQLENLYLNISNITIIQDKLGYLDIINYKKLYSFLKENKIQCICDLTGDFGGRVLLTANKAGVKKRIASYRSSDNFFKKTPAKVIYNKWVRYLTYKNSSKIISNSKAAFDNFYPKIWKNSNKFHVIYNGVIAEPFLEIKGDLRSELNIPKDAFIVGHTGRYTSVKNHKLILEVAEILITKYPDIYFLLCGNGVYNNLEKRIIDLKLNKKIFTFENRSDIPIFLNTLDCYIFPSLTEGQPNALIEAMLVGLPYVASDIAPIRETVDNYDYLYSPDDLNGFVSAIEEIYRNRIKQQRSRFNNLKIVKNFDAENLFDQFYEALTN